MLQDVNDQRVGRSLYVLRHRLGLRQDDIAIAADVAQSVVSEIEAGRIADKKLTTIRRVFAAVDAGFDGEVRWRGAALDRLIDARHGDLVGIRASHLRACAWEPVVEATYSIFGERGSIDVLGASSDHRAVVVEEVKTTLASIEAMVRKLDEKVRLVRDRIALDRFGWRPVAVGRILVLPETTTARQQVARHSDVLDIAFPGRAIDVRRWLRQPIGDLSAIVFVRFPRR